MKTILFVVLVAMALLTTSHAQQPSGAYEITKEVPQMGSTRFKLVIKSSHTATLYISAMGRNESEEVTYKVDGNNFRYTITGESKVGNITRPTGRECISLVYVGLLCKNK
jgi:hypothetical protein